MNLPPHTIDAAPDGLREDLYASRNNFLFLLLGLISTAEDVLGVMPEIASLAPCGGTPTPGGSPVADGSSLFR